MFTAISFAVLAAVPPMLNEPLMVALPDAVNKALRVLVALMVSVAPEFMVRLLHTPVAPDNSGWFAGTEGITTFSPASGTCPSDQFAATPQDVLVEPSQVFWEKTTSAVKIKEMIAKIVKCFFIISCFYLDIIFR
jgi:hypothetical protein